MNTATNPYQDPALARWMDSCEGVPDWTDPAETRGIKLREMVPLFVLGFVGMTLIRTIGDSGERPFGLMDKVTWDAITEMLKNAAEMCLMVAMAAVGLGTSLSRLKSLGLRPLGIGLIAAALVGAVSVALLYLLSPKVG